MAAALYRVKQPQGIRDAFSVGEAAAERPAVQPDMPWSAGPVLVAAVLPSQVVCRCALHAAACSARFAFSLLAAPFYLFAVGTQMCVCSFLACVCLCSKIQLPATWTRCSSAYAGRRIETPWIHEKTRTMHTSTEIRGNGGLRVQGTAA